MNLLSNSSNSTNKPIAFVSQGNVITGIVFFAFCCIVAIGLVTCLGFPKIGNKVINKMKKCSTDLCGLFKKNIKPININTPLLPKVIATQQRVLDS